MIRRKRYHTFPMPRHVRTGSLETFRCRMVLTIFVDFTRIEFLPQLNHFHCVRPATVFDAFHCKVKSARAEM